MKAKSSSIKALATLVVAALCICCLPMMVGSAEAAAGDSSSTPYEVSVPQGRTWQYTTAFTSSLSVTVTVASSSSSFSGCTSFSPSSGWASVNGKTVSIAVPSDATAGSSYYVVIKGTTTNPTQNAYQYIKVNVIERLTITGTTSGQAVVGQAFSWTPTTNVGNLSHDTNCYSITGTLPTGLSFDQKTGTISGTPTASKASTSYTVTVNSTSPAQSSRMTYTLVTYSAVSAGSDVTQNMIVNSTDASVSAVTQASDLTTVSHAVTSGTLPAGLTLNTTTGAITGKITDSNNVYNKQVVVTATGNGPSNTSTRTVTFNYEKAASITSGTGTFYAVAGTAKTATTLNSNIDGKEVWSITSGGATGISINSSSGAITTTAATPAGSYTLTVRVASSVVTSNATTSTVTLKVEPAVTLTAPEYVYAAVGGAFDAASLTSTANTVSSNSYSITDYGDLTNGSTKISVNSSTGAISASGMVAGDEGDHTITVKVTTTGGQTDTATFTLSVAGQLVYTSSPTAGFIVTA